MTANSLGLIGAHHIGITVPDLDQAIAFFRDVLGLEALVHSAPDQVNIGYVTTHLGAEEESRLVRRAILPCLGANVELLEYTKPGGLGAAPAPSNNGATHLALSVKDAAAAARYLRDRGVMVLEGPSKVEDGDLAARALQSRGVRRARRPAHGPSHRQGENDSSQNPLPQTFGVQPTH